MDAYTLQTAGINSKGKHSKGQIALPASTYVPGTSACCPHGLRNLQWACGVGRRRFADLEHEGVDSSLPDRPHPSDHRRRRTPPRKSTLPIAKEQGTIAREVGATLLGGDLCHPSSASGWQLSHMAESQNCPRCKFMAQGEARVTETQPREPEEPFGGTCDFLNSKPGNGSPG